MKISDNFHQEQFTSGELRNSALAGVPQVVPPSAIANIKILVNTMEQVLKVLQRPIIITSGYRGPVRTEEMGDPLDSPHTTGLACDFICPMIELQEMCTLIDQSNIVFDQLIYYHSWGHLGLTADSRGPRQQALTLTGSGEFVPGIVDNT
jgi:zinc D-Ala-D-Ala carboxypeptidase